MQTQQSTEKIFGLLIPGMLPIFDFELINGMLICDLLNPGNKGVKFTSFIYRSCNNSNILFEYTST